MNFSLHLKTIKQHFENTLLGLFSFVFKCKHGLESKDVSKSSNLLTLADMAESFASLDPSVAGHNDSHELSESFVVNLSS